MVYFKLVVFAVLFISFDCISAVKVAAILKLSDSYAKFPQDILNSFKAGRKILGAEKLIDVKSFSHDGTPESLKLAIENAVIFKPDIVFGGETSAFSLQIARAFPQTIFITPTASSSMLSEVHNNVFRMTQSDEQYLGIIDYALKKINKKSIKVGVYNNISFPNTKAISESAIKYLKEKYDLTPIEIKVVSDEEITEQKIRPFIDSKIDVLVLFSFENDLRKAYSILSKRNLHPLYLGADGWGRDEFLSSYLLSSNKRFSGLRVVYWDPTRKDSSFKNSKSELEKALSQKIDFFHAIGFDSVKFIVDTIRKNSDLSQFKKTVLGQKYTNFLTSQNFSFSEKLTPLKNLYGQKISDGELFYLGDISNE